MDYIMIRAWGQFNQLPARWVRDEIQIAQDDNAPHNVIYKREDGLWATIEDVKGGKRVQVERIAHEIQSKDNTLTRTIY